jgi:hypothetical protein
VKREKNEKEEYQSQVSILGPVGYGHTTLPLRSRRSIGPFVTRLEGTAGARLSAGSDERTAADQLSAQSSACPRRERWHLTLTHATCLSRYQLQSFPYHIYQLLFFCHGSRHVIFFSQTGQCFLLLLYSISDINFAWTFRK